MVRDTLLGFPAHTLPYRRGKFITLSTASQGAKRRPVFHVYKMPVSRFETQRTRNSVPLHRITLLVVHLVHVGHEVQQLAGVAPFVIIPCNELHEIVIQHDTGSLVKDAGLGKARQVG